MHQVLQQGLSARIVRHLRLLRHRVYKCIRKSCAVTQQQPRIAIDIGTAIEHRRHALHYHLREFPHLRHRLTESPSRCSEHGNFGLFAGLPRGHGGLDIFLLMLQIKHHQMPTKVLEQSTHKRLARERDAVPRHHAAGNQRGHERLHQRVFERISAGAQPIEDQKPIAQHAHGVEPESGHSLRDGGRPAAATVKKRRVRDLHHPIGERIIPHYYPSEVFEGRIRIFVGERVDLGQRGGKGWKIRAPSDPSFQKIQRERHIAALVDQRDDTVEIRHQFDSRGVACRRVGLQHLAQEGDNFLADPSVAQWRPVDHPAAYRIEQIGQGVVLPRRLTSEDLVEHESQRIDVRGRTQRRPRQMLRGQIARGALKARLAGFVLTGGRQTGQTKVHDARPAVITKHDVAGREIEMQNAILMCRRKSRSNTRHDRQGVVLSKAASFAHHRAQDLAGHILEHQHRLSVVLEYVKDRNHIRVGDARCEPGLGHHRVAVARTGSRFDHLQRDLAPKLGIQRLEHRPLSTLAEVFRNHKAPNHRAVHIHRAAQSFTC